MMATEQQDYYELLQIASTATADEVEAAYATQYELYAPEHLAAGPPEFQELARQRREGLEDAYRVLRDPQRRAAYDRLLRNHAAPPLVLDYRPLPPARRRERPSPSIPLPPVEPAARPRERRDRRSVVAPLIVGCAVLGILLLLVLSGVRTSGGAAALATPVIPDLNLPFSPAEVAAARDRAQKTPSAEAWAAYGNVVFDNMAAIRERSPLAPQYLNQLGQWREAAQSYSRALELGAKPDVRADMALSLFYYGTAANDQGAVQQSVSEVERARKEEPDAPRTLLNYGLIMSGLNPPRLDETRAAWNRLVKVAPDSPLAKRAQSMLANLGQ